MLPDNRIASHEPASSYINVNSIMMLKVIVFISLMVVMVLTQTTVDPSTCPSKCNCTNATTVSCIGCLEIYFRTYDVANKNCPCLPNFVEIEAIGSFCCPANCSVCTGLGGCASCRPTWKLALTKSGVGVCVCRDNFFYDGVECRCLSRIQPALFYEVLPENACYPCPKGCTCSIHGCISCQSNSFRSITNVTNLRGQQTSVCSCKFPFRETSDGQCVCPKDCNCTGSLIQSCNASSNRFYSTKSLTWQCSEPYQQINATCACVEPYRMVSEDDKTSKCVCGSRKDYNNYYTNQQQQCLPCPINCICYSIGCQWCTGAAFRTLTFYVCPCTPPFRQVLGTCQCYSPYYMNGWCLCMNEVFPTRYYNYSDAVHGAQCEKCPEGCTCNTSGCVACKPSALRIIQLINKASICVKCAPNSEMVNGTCRCIDGSELTQQGTCGCLHNLVVYYQAENTQCSSCPYGCNCTSDRGCFYCPGNALRNVTTDPRTNRSSCPCVYGAREGDVDRMCYCVISSNSSNPGQCICPNPYYMDSVTGKCKCMSEKQPSLYYKDLYTDECRYCPLSCNCDPSGCTFCGANTQRFVYTDRGYSQCLCYQTVSLNDDCSKCQPHHFFANGECIACWDCVDCNDIGQCTKCGKNMTLLANGTCQCNQPMMKNVNGTCVCEKTSYFLNGICNPCPPFCHFCEYQPNQDQHIFCTSCMPGVHRLNTAWYNCLCEPGYRESPSGTKYYCCHQKCGDCNATGCISCIADTNRTLNQNQECVCVGNMIEKNGSIVCACPFGYFPLDGHCQMCPKYCNGCFFQQKTIDIQCIACPENSSRIMEADDNGNRYCYCARFFQQTAPESWYCFPRYCKNQEPVCTECEGNRMPINNGMSCVCKPTFFQDGVGQCVSCNMLGCLNCQSEHLCVLCDSANSYILTQSTCKKLMNDSIYIYAQTHTGIYVQFQNEFEQDTDFELVSVNATLQQIRPELSNESVLFPSVPLRTYLSMHALGNIIYARFSHPDAEINSSIMGNYYELRKYVFPIRSTSYDSDDKGTYLSSGSSGYLRIERCYSSTHMNFEGRSYATTAKVLTVVTLFVVLSLYLKGFKHNQTVFFLETMAFLQFVVEDPRLEKTVFLHNLRYSYLMFGNALSGLIPSDYIEDSSGNFSYFTLDSNLFRLAGTPLVIAAITAIVAGSLRLFMWCKLFSRYRRHSKGKEIINSTKKGIYRLIEFFYKTCMYPALYFSFVTLHNWKPRVLTDHPHYMAVCFGMAVMICIAYSLVTLFQIWFEGTSQIHKIENASEFLSCCAAGSILCLTIFNKLYLLLIILVLFRGSTYVMLRRTILRDFMKIEYIKLFTTLLEIASICLTLTDNTPLIAAAIGVTVLCQLAHACTIVFMSSYHGTLQKQTTKSQNFDNQNIDEETVAKDTNSLTSKTTLHYDTN